jgi:probable rRNA maturation factor
MAELNRIYRNRGGAAEILTFPYGAGLGVEPGSENSFGEIYLCGRSLAKGAKRRGVSVASYMVRLIVHGLLHITGHHHEGAGGERRMEARERQLLLELLPRDDVERLFA